jgi:hypothetical protein
MVVAIEKNHVAAQRSSPGQLRLAWIEQFGPTRIDDAEAVIGQRLAPGRDLGQRQLEFFQIGVGADPQPQLFDIDLEAGLIAAMGTGDLVQPLFQRGQVEITGIVGQNRGVPFQGAVEPFAQFDGDRFQCLLAVAVAAVIDLIFGDPRKSALGALAAGFDIGGDGRGLEPLERAFQPVIGGAAGMDAADPEEIIGREGQLAADPFAAITFLMEQGRGIDQQFLVPDRRNAFRCTADIDAYSAVIIDEGFKSRVAIYIERTQSRREALWTRPAPLVGASI